MVDQKKWGWFTLHEHGAASTGVAQNKTLCCINIQYAANRSIAHNNRCQFDADLHSCTGPMRLSGMGEESATIQFAYGNVPIRREKSDAQLGGPPPQSTLEAEEQHYTGRRRYPSLTTIPSIGVGRVSVHAERPRHAQQDDQETHKRHPSLLGICWMQSGHSCPPHRCNIIAILSPSIHNHDIPHCYVIVCKAHLAWVCVLVTCTAGIHSCSLPVWN